MISVVIEGLVFLGRVFSESDGIKQAKGVVFRVIVTFNKICHH